MGVNINELGKALEASAAAAARAAISALQVGDGVRRAVGNVLLEGVATNAATLSSIPVEVALAISQRLPFADSQSICAATLKASEDAARYVPYLVTIDTLFVVPGAVIYEVETAIAGMPAAGLALTTAAAKATIILALLADPPDISNANFDNLLRDVTVDAGELAKDLFKMIEHSFDPSFLLSGKPFDAAMRLKLEQLKDDVDQFLGTRLGQVNSAMGNVVAGVPKIFHAAVRGAERIHAAVLAQHELLCGEGRDPARQFFLRRDDTLSLDRTYASIAPGANSWSYLVSGGDTDLYTVDAAGEQSRAEFGLSGKTTELTLERRRTTPPPPMVIEIPFLPPVIIDVPFAPPLKRFEHRVRELTVFAESEAIPIGEVPIPEPISGRILLLETRSDQLSPGQQIIITGVDQNGEPIAELASIALYPSAVTTVDGRTRIELTQDLEFSYRRDTARINANVAAATHGESIREILGSGNAAASHQRFSLAQAPLTHIAAATDTGEASTLAVTVNDLLWTEVPTLVGRGPRDRVFETSADASGRTTVVFGDGREGALPPSGHNNVRARYRKGLGSAGNLPPNKLTTLLTRPPGLIAVTNPLITEGGADAESPEHSRQRAPMTVRTLGRAVSLADYEDFAATFGGVGKALATWLPGTRNGGILLTIAAADGSPVTDESETRTMLLAALRKFGDPLVPIDIVSFRPVRFQLKATLTIAADRLPEVVLPNVERALDAHFSMAAMRFGESISIDDVMAAIHTVDGVVAVDVDLFYRSSPADPRQWNARLDAALPSLDGWQRPQGAELLTIAAAPREIAFVQLRGLA